MRTPATVRFLLPASLALATLLNPLTPAVAQTTDNVTGPAASSIRRANAAYSAEDFRTAAAAYEDALARDASNTDLYFYLANSYDRLHTPGMKGDAVSAQYLARALEYYQRASVEATTASIRHIAKQYLVSAYMSPDKLNDPASAEPVLQSMITADPEDVTNYFVLSRLYEDEGNYAAAEQQLLIARERQPLNSAVYMNAAGFYQRQGNFEKMIEAVEERTRREPTNPEAFYTLATFYWEKASRDDKLPADRRTTFAQLGIDAVNTALELKADYFEALTYKNLLLRTMANLSGNPDEKQRLIQDADILRKQAEELRNQQRAVARPPGTVGPSSQLPTP